MKFIINGFLPLCWDPLKYSSNLRIGPYIGLAANTLPCLADQRGMYRIKRKLQCFIFMMNSLSHTIRDGNLWIDRTEKNN